MKTFNTWKSLITLFSLILSMSITAQNAINFDGTNDYVSMTNGGPLGSASRTVEAWVRSSNSISSQQIIVDWGQMSPNGSRFTLNMINFGKLRIEVGGNGFNSTTSIADGQWHHVAVTYDNSASTKFKLYIDGSVDVSSNTTVGVNTLTGGILIGRRNDGVNHFEGDIDEVRIWNTVRSTSEISSNMNTEFCGSAPGLVAYYKCNSGTAGSNNSGVTTLTDYSSNSNNGTLNNFALSGNTSNWVTGKTLSVPAAAMDTIVDTICKKAKYVFGSQVLTAPGIYNDTLVGPGGCDSIVNLTLIADSVDASAKHNGANFKANNPNGTYQWVNCTSNYSIVFNETNQSYFPTDNDYYAVIVTEGSCSDTSDCFSLLQIGMEEETLNSFEIYPNPANSKVTLSINQLDSDYSLSIVDLSGRVVYEQPEIFTKETVLNLDIPNGIYFVRFNNENHKMMKKLIIQQ